MVFGTRPEAIKMVPVYRQLQDRAEIEVDICVTGQHREMLDQVLDVFGIEPRFDLDLMRPGQDLTDVTAAVILALRGVLQDNRYDRVLVHGDTTTALAAALAARYAQVPVGHVEAGLRTGNPSLPWPEEMNRLVVARLADLHFAPTEEARQNLLAENIPAAQIRVTGNTVIDALQQVVARFEQEAALEAEMRHRFAFLKEGVPMILVTGHRRETFGRGLENICQALRGISEDSDAQIVYPLHLNPQVQEPVRRILGEQASVHLIAPQDYLPFVWLMRRAALVLTDSGGVQEEAPCLGKPVLVMRELTERPEAVAAGVVRLVGTDPRRIRAETLRLLQEPQAYAQMARARSPYGDGRAAERIVAALTQA